MEEGEAWTAEVLASKDLDASVEEDMALERGYKFLDSMTEERPTMRDSIQYSQIQSSSTKI